MESKAFKFKGLNLKQNQLERDGNTARDCENVRLDDYKNLIKSEEFSALSLPYESTDDYENWDDELPTDSSIIDCVHFNGKIILLVKTPPISISTLDFAVSMYEYDISGDTLSVIPFNNINADFDELGWANYNSTTFDGKVTHFEKDDCLYFMSSANSQTGLGSGTPIMMKYDGKVWYAAGVPELNTFTTSQDDEGTLAGGASGDYYVRYLPMYIDNQGNQIFGSVGVNKLTASSFVLTQATNTIFSTQNDYHYTRVWLTDVAGHTLTDAALTFQATVEGTIGQIVYILDSSDNLYRFTIASYSGGDVTLSEPKLYSGGVWVDTSGFSISMTYLDAMSSTLIAAYFSTDYSSGFEFGDVVVASHVSTGGSGNISFDTTSPETLPDWALFSEQLEDCYDITSPKGNPPAGLQLREYGTASLILTTVGLYFSDTGINGTVENFVPLDFIEVGDDDKGDLKCFFSNPTFIAVMRERESYLISGNIFTGNYSIRSYRATGKGGQAPAGVGDLNGQAIFPSNITIEAALENGEIQPIGDRIEPLFSNDILSLGLDLSTCDIALDFIRQNIHIAIEGSSSANNKVLVYDYDSNEWFKYDWDCSGGLLFNPDDNLMYYSDGSDLYQEQASYSSGIDAYWYSNFESLGKASFKKRFPRLTLFDTNYLTGAVGFKSYKDWKTATAITDETIAATSVSPIPSRRLNPNICYSCAFDLESEGTAILNLDGFEYDYIIEQEESNKDGR